MDRGSLERIDASFESRSARYAVPTDDGSYLLDRGDAEGSVMDVGTAETVATFPVGQYLPPTPSPDGTCFATGHDGSVEVRTLPDAAVVGTLSQPGDFGPFARFGGSWVSPRGGFVYLPGPRGRRAT